MDTEKGLEKQLKLLRKKKNITQSQLADLLGLGQTAVANYETGKRFPDETILVSLADALNVSIDNLLDREFVPREADEVQPGFNYTPSELGGRKDEFMEKALSSGNSALEMLIGLLESGYSEEQILIDLLEVSLIEVGKKWSEGKFSEAMEHQISMTALQSIFMMQFKTHASRESSGKAVFLTAAGENHNIGLKMLSRFMEIDGWECFYLGASVPTRTLKEYVITSSIDLVCISLTLNENIDSASALIRSVKEIDNAPYIMVGGAGTKLNQKVLFNSGVDYIHQSINETIKVSRTLI